MIVAEIDRGLWRWTERHPEWTRAQGGVDGWGPDVGSVYCEAFGDVVLVDPVLPPAGDERERFWRALDRDVARAAGPPRIVLTCSWHTRGSSDIAERYAGTTIWAPGSSEPLPGRALAVEAALAGEVLLWLRSHRALVAGDTLVGDGAGGIRLCPEPWLGERDPADVGATLWTRLRELPVERVLVSHGDPVLSGGRDALAVALARD